MVNFQLYFIIKNKYKINENKSMNIGANFFIKTSDILAVDS